MLMDSNFYLQSPHDETWAYLPIWLGLGCLYFPHLLPRNIPRPTDGWLGLGFHVTAKSFCLNANSKHVTSERRQGIYWSSIRKVTFMFVPGCSAASKLLPNLFIRIPRFTTRQQTRFDITFLYFISGIQWQGLIANDIPLPLKYRFCVAYSELTLCRDASVWHYNYPTYLKMWNYLRICASFLILHFALIQPLFLCSVILRLNVQNFFFFT